MALNKTNPTQTEVWKKLTTHYKETKDAHLRDLFSSDAKRAEKFTLQWKDFLFDYSKNRISTETMQLLLQLTKEVNLKGAIEGYYDGDIINETEGRAVLHTALRAKKSDKVLVDGGRYNMHTLSNKWHKKPHQKCSQDKSS